MREKITGVLLIMVLGLAMAAMYLWLNLSVDDPISIEVKLLIAASLLSFLGLISVYYFQKIGYLKNRFINFLTLLFSIAFLAGASFLLFASYNTYNKRLQTIEAKSVIEIFSYNDATFSSEESQTYINLKESRNILLGYETFFKQTAQNYDPSNYSYANVLKSELIDQLANKAGTQTYWDDILNNLYVFDTISNTYKRGGYEIMYVFGNDMYPNEDLANTADMDLIFKTSVSEYWQSKLLVADRTPESLTAFWKDNKAFMYTFFSKSQYDRLCKQVIDDLISIKEKINEQPNYQEFYENYDISDSEFLTFPDRDFVKSYRYSWPFSFWDRRFHEGNDTVIFEILNEIQRHYKN
tara:strand:+ start:1098 stop:2156 length:1059 start_codon:yes stop_codon:yes gene_type:complete